MDRSHGFSKGQSPRRVGRRPQAALGPVLRASCAPPPLQSHCRIEALGIKHGGDAH